ncbi:hypothetical protein LQ757_03710 [Agromyces sp. SYSU K20354]|uniref:hypothetical protein n=1 Tax=Agromyces cavernae TaxID=2898659 RepID=UPI001E57B9E4|nr:hypothetical protein [Agromyces cavernae]MCD2441380.1 hypothetical protein [Agromyces cavernae]
MTLTRILPTLRRTIPDPIAVDRWPRATRATVGDIEVGGVSLLRLTDLCGTPAVHIAPASVPGSNGTVASPTMQVGVVVVRVVEASEHLDGRARSLTLDADLGALDPAWSEARLIGRASVARAIRTELGAGPGDPTATASADLPDDIASGDLIALPYAALADDAGIARPSSGWRANAPTASPVDDIAGR